MNKIEVFTLDLNGENGTPFRFMWWPYEDQETEKGTIRYYDREYTAAEGEPGYGINHMNENGQACGGPLLVSAFTDSEPRGLRGWHGVYSWNIDRTTRERVGSWLRTLARDLKIELP